MLQNTNDLVHLNILLRIIKGEIQMTRLKIFFAIGEDETALDQYSTFPIEFPEMDIDEIRKRIQTTAPVLDPAQVNLLVKTEIRRRLGADVRVKIAKMLFEKYLNRELMARFNLED